MISETRICTFCKNSFHIDDDDIAFYKKINNPSPTLCPDDRQRRRASWRNERNLYKRTCDATGKEIISMYSPDKPYPVYEQEYWWSDNWDPKKYGQDIDFSRQFFEQYHELQKKVPRVSLFNWQSENSHYTNHSGENKNCYMGVDLGGCEDVYFSNWVMHSKNCIDCSYTYTCELCYQTLYCEKCFNCDFCQECEGCMDCVMCFDCKGCRNCFGCTGLRNKEFYIFNKKVTEEEYEKFIENYKYSYKKQQEAWKKFQNFQKTQPHRYALIIQSEECIGDYIYYSKNAKQCFDVVKLWDCRYCYNTLEVKNGYDCYQPGFGDSELVCEIHGGNGLFSCKCMHISRNLHDCEYCDQCHYSNDLFGCIGLRRSEFCILNKQYTEGEYRKLKSRLIEHMKKTGEYGEFFPIWASPFGYNESKANEYYPLTKDEAKTRGFSWSEYVPALPQGESIEPPDDIREVDESILQKIIPCEESGKPFRLIRQEFDFYKRKNLPIPQISPQKRYEARMALRRPRHLWGRTCAKCGAEIRTTYSPTNSESVYCEQCYLKAIY